jgi:hypothetical protein
MIEFVRWTIDSSDEHSPSRIPHSRIDNEEFLSPIFGNKSRIEFNHGDSIDLIMRRYRPVYLALFDLTLLRLTRLVDDDDIRFSSFRSFFSLALSYTGLHASMQRLLERPLSLHHLRRSYQNFPFLRLLACLCVRALTQKEKQANNTIELFSHRLEYGRIS